MTTVWLVDKEEDTAANLAVVTTIRTCRTCEEAEAYCRSHQRRGHYSHRSLLSVSGPWTDTGAGYARREDTKGYTPA
jgi:hypothetical protein